MDGWILIDGGPSAKLKQKEPLVFCSSLADRYHALHVFLCTCN